MVGEQEPETSEIRNTASIIYKKLLKAAIAYIKITMIIIVNVNVHGI